MEQSYKILAAQRLAIDPNALLIYFEMNEHALATTPDGVQHIFTFAELRHPAVRADQRVSPVAKKQSATRNQKSPIK